MRVILYGGFHKTGTTTVQKTLRRNRQLLKPHLRLTLRPGMAALCEAARAWSSSRDPVDLALLRYEAATLAEGWDAGDRRPILLASEDLSGHMPGRRGLSRYDATPALMRCIAESVEAVQPDARITFYFSTRAARPWLASCHAQHLRATRMTLDRESYARDYRASADLEAVVDAVADAVAPRPVQRAALEELADAPQGPLTPLLNLAGIPDATRRSLSPLPPQNQSPGAARRAALLALNRSAMDDAALAAAKRALPGGDG